MNPIAVYLERFERMHGWGLQTGWSTRERLVELGIGDVYEPMVEGAAEADKLPMALEEL